MTKCSNCGKIIYRKRIINKNQYGSFGPMCIDCRHQKVRERDRKDYMSRILPSIITEEEMRLLNELNSYPVTPRNIGTHDQSTNLKIIYVNGKYRVSGAVWLENNRKSMKDY